ncbi:unnamed protein product [Alopecurus aequalis]
MSFASRLTPPPPRLPRGRVGLPPPSSSTVGRPSLGFGPTRAATTKGRRLIHISCFRQEQDGSTSDDGTGFKYIEQVEISGDREGKEEEGGSPKGEEQDYEKTDWFVSVLKIKANLQEIVSRFWNKRWIVPWTGQTIAQVMFLWIATFWLVGSWIVPFLAHAAGFSKETLTHRGQALYSLLTDITEGLAGIAIIHQCLGPVAGVSSVEQSIVARDPVAMALYALVVTVCAPIWEEIVFRGFLLPSLTRSRNLLASMVLHSLWNGFVFLDLMK